MKLNRILQFILSASVLSGTHPAAAQDPPPDQTDVRIYPSSNPQTENSIAVNPTNPQQLFVSTNGDLPSYKQTWFFSTNGGQSWSGSENSPPGAPALRGDPVALFDLANNAFFVTLGQIGVYVMKTSNLGATWGSAVNADPSTTNNDDKPHAMTDLSGTYPSNIYVVWTDRQLLPGDVVLTRSTNGGASFGPRTVFEVAPNRGSGANIAIGPNGEVYLAFAIYPDGKYPESEIRFAKSTDGGSTWSSASSIFPIWGINDSQDLGDPDFNSTRVNSFPSMGVDRSNGLWRGRIYIVYADRSTGDADIYLNRSTDGGTSWSSKIRVNGEMVNNGKQQWFPSIAVDPMDGTLYVSYYSMDTTVAFLTARYMAISTDGGTTFVRRRVSDDRFIPHSLGIGFGEGYMGDYYETAAYGGKAWACWSDTVHGNVYQAFVSGIQPPLVTQTLANGTVVDSIAHWETNHFTKYKAPKTLLFIANANEVLRGAQKLISNQKYKDWNSLDSVHNHHIFQIIQPSGLFTSNLRSTDVTMTIKADLIDAPGSAGGEVEFKDPWFIDSSDASHGNSLMNRGMRAPFKKRSSPFYPDVAHPYESGLKYNGVFLNVNYQTAKNYYSVGGPSPQVVGGFNSYFYKWTSGPGAATFQNASASRTGVMFTQSNTTITAQYKAHLASSEQTASGPGGQRKILYISGSGAHAVYASGGSIWYMKDIGTGWTPEVQLSAPGVTAKNPSIAAIYINPSNQIHVVWEETVQDPTGTYQVATYRRSTNGGTSWEGAIALAATSPQWTYAGNGIDVTPAIAGAGDNVVVIWRFNVDGAGLVMRASPSNSQTPYVQIRGTNTTSKTPSLDALSGYKLVYEHNNGKVYFDEFILGTNYYPTYIGAAASDISAGLSGCANPSVTMAPDQYGYGNDHVFVSWDASTEIGRRMQVRERIGLPGTNWTSSVVQLNHLTHTGQNGSIGYDIEANRVTVLWQCNTHIAKESRPVSGTVWSAVRDFGAGYSPNLASIWVYGSKEQGMWTSGGAAPYAVNAADLSPILQTYTQNSTATGGQRKLVRGPSGTLYLAYSSEGDIRFTKSSDNGVTWNPERVLSRGMTDCSYPCITERTAGSNSFVCVAWQRPNGSNWDICYNYSNNAGDGWPVWPFTLASNFSCPSPGPTPVIMASDPSNPPNNPFSLMVVFRRSTDLASYRATTNTPDLSGWTFLSVPGTSSLSHDPSLAYQNNVTGYYRMAWCTGGGVYHQTFNGSAWNSPFLVNPVLGGQVYNNYFTTLALSALSQGFDTHIAWEGTRPPWREIIHNKNLNTSAYTEFVYPFNGDYYAPSITGHSNGRVSLLWHGPGNSIYKAVYNGSGWGAVTTIASNGLYPTASINNPPGGQGWVVWTGTTGPPYSVVFGPTGGPLQNVGPDTIAWNNARRVALITHDSGELLTIEAQEPLANSDSLLSLPYVSFIDSLQYDASTVWTMIETTPQSISPEQLPLRITRVIASREPRGASDPQLTTTYVFELVEVSTGLVLASSTFQPIANDSMVSIQDTLELYASIEHSTIMKFRIRPAGSLSTDKVQAGIFDIYRQGAGTQVNKLQSRSVGKLVDLPTGFRLQQNYPNPFNPITVIKYDLPVDVNAAIKVYDILGKEVATLVDGFQKAGYHQVSFDANRLATGVYFYRMAAGRFTDVKKLLIVK